MRNQQAVENAWFFAPPAGSDPLPRQPFFPSSAYDTTPLDAELSLSGPLGGTTDSLLLNDLQSEQEDPTRITPKLKEPGRTFLKAYTPYALKKITLFARVFDLHILTDSSVVYNPCWAYQWESMFMDCIQKDSPLQIFATGDSHTVAVNSASRAFTWGWNDEGQCGRPEGELTSEYKRNLPLRLETEARIKQIECGADHSVMLDQDGKVHVWGSNAKG